MKVPQRLREKIVGVFGRSRRETLTRKMILKQFPPAERFNVSCMLDPLIDEGTLMIVKRESEEGHKGTNYDPVGLGDLIMVSPTPPLPQRGGVDNNPALRHR